MAEDKSLQKMDYNENTDRPFKVMELESLPFVIFHILCNYRLENGLSFIPERSVLVSEEGLWELVGNFLVGL